LATHRSRIKKYRAVRKLGVSTVAMARMAATPTIAYGCDIVGMSDTHLQAARVAVATSAAPSSGGKTPDIILFALDVAGGSLDPIFSATVLLIKHWALAWWDGWTPQKDLMVAMEWAIAKLKRAKGSVWHHVAGPTTALVASLWRVGWSIIDAQTFVSDDGSHLCCLLDSPAAFALEANRSVHRWQLARVVKLNPLIAPPCTGSASAEPAWMTSQSIVPSKNEPPQGVRVAELTARLPQSVVGVTRPLARLLHGKKTFVKTQPLWERRHKPFLLSTMVGGQWTQTRVAQVQGPDTSRLCQLCHTTDGTLEHRHACPATTPCGGWPRPPVAVSNFIAQLDPVRRRFLTTRGILLLHVPVPPPSRDGWFKWLKPLPDIDLAGATWFIDGSAIDGPSHRTVRLGFGVVVVAANGELIAFGQGAPPAWIKDSAGAEMWALYVVADCNPCLPRIITDCLGLLDMLAKGVVEATKAGRPMARLWAMIFRCTDAVTPTFGLSDDFIWMPSHCSAAAARNMIKSNGEPITPTEWRSNRLADGLAKHAAAKEQISTSVLDTLRHADASVEFAAAMVGTTSWHANNSSRTTWASTGELLTLKCRDSAPPTAHKLGSLTGLNKKRRDLQHQQTPEGAPPRHPAEAAAATSSGSTTTTTTHKPLGSPGEPPPQREPATRSARAALELKRAEQEARGFNSWLRGLNDKDLQPQTSQAPAADRLAALRARVRERQRQAEQEARADTS